MRQLAWLTALALLAVVVVRTESSAGTFATIAIDGDFSDWAGIPVLDSDPADNAGGPDLGETQIANDENYLYIRNTFLNNDSMPVYIALDNDSNLATGFDVFSAGLVGSEASWLNDFAFAQASGVFNSGNLSGEFFGGGHAILSPFVDATSEREVAISLNALFAADNSPVFPNSTFTLLLYTDAGFDVSAPIEYTLAVAIPECSTLALTAIAAIAIPFWRKRQAATNVG